MGEHPSPNTTCRVWVKVIRGTGNNGRIKHFVSRQAMKPATSDASLMGRRSLDHGTNIRRSVCRRHQGNPWRSSCRCLPDWQPILVELMRRQPLCKS